MSDGQYKSCLGHAAEVDRNEQPYALCTLQGVESTVHACVQHPSQFALLTAGLVASMGKQALAGRPPIEDGLKTQERELAIGTITLFSFVLSTASPEAKKLVLSACGKMVEMLGDTNNLEESIEAIGAAIEELKKEGLTQ